MLLFPSLPSYDSCFLSYLSICNFYNAVTLQIIHIQGLKPSNLTYPSFFLVWLIAV